MQESGQGSWLDWLEWIKVNEAKAEGKSELLGTFWGEEWIGAMIEVIGQAVNEITLQNVGLITY